VHRVLFPVLLLLCSGAGCIGVNFERVRDGLPGTVRRTSTLVPGKTTLSETLTQLGPPDLLLRAGTVDRAYYSAFDSDYFKLIIQASIPAPGRSFSWDVFIQTLGFEDLHLARLEFDPGGTLRDVQSTIFKHSRNGRYFAIDNRIVSQYLEDKRRMLALADDDDDEEDVEIDEPARKAKER
jgi:hypothetical protein